MATYYNGYELTRAVIQLAGSVQAATSATDTITDTAHGLAVGDMVVITTIGGASGVALATRYFVVNVPTADTFKISATAGGSAISLGTATPSYKAMTEVALAYPNQIEPSAERDTYEWRGGGVKKKLEALVGTTLAISLDCIPLSAHQTIFSKTALGALPSMAAGGVGIGGGADTQGVSCGIRIEGNAIKNVDGAETTVEVGVWYPVGTLTLSAAPGQQSGQIFGKSQYSFSATKTATDILGGTIASVSSDGEFFIVAELS